MKKNPKIESQIKIDADLDNETEIELDQEDQENENGKSERIVDTEIAPELKYKSIDEVEAELNEITKESMQINVKDKLPEFEKLSKILKNTCKTLDQDEVVFLVYNYYSEQEKRKGVASQVRSLKERGKESAMLQWLLDFHGSTEKEIKKALDIYTQNHPVGQWIRQIHGIGEVIAAGLLAHIDINKVESAGQIWSFAGLNPYQEWKPGEKRPWNARLKTLCWKIGQSFVKMSNSPYDFYGKIYKTRKAYEQKMNEEFKYKSQAEAKLEKYKIGKETEAYKWYIKGMLPPGHIQQRAERYATKLFLSHLFEVWYRIEKKKEPPKPYVISILNHKDYIPPEMAIIPKVEVDEKEKKVRKPRAKKVKIESPE